MTTKSFHLNAELAENMIEWIIQNNPSKIKYTISQNGITDTLLLELSSDEGFGPTIFPVAHRISAKTNLETKQSNCTVKIQGLPYNADAEELKQLFKKAGEILCFCIAHNRETGKPTGQAMCKYKNETDATVAVNTLNDIEYKSRNLMVSIFTE